MRTNALPALLLLAACSTDEGPAKAGSEAVTYYRDVKPILDAHCLSCHQAGAMGTFSLEDPAAAVALADDLAEAVVSLQMPPWMPDEGCTTYKGDPSLSPEERQAVSDWAAAGAPLGDEADATVVEAWQPPALDRVDLTIAMPVAYTPDPAADDVYRCFLIPWPETETRYVTGFNMLPGNLSIVHHVINYVVPPSQLAVFQALEAEDPEPGYACFGGPGPEDPTTMQNIRWLGAWAPGGGANVFPAGTGIEVEPGSYVAMQVHYNSGAGDGGADTTQVELTLADTVDIPARLQPWTDVLWVVSGGMDIPAQTDDVTHSFVYDHPADKNPVTLHSVQLHMHKMGTGGSLVINHADGSQDCVVDTARYDFNWQRSYFLEQSVTLNPGDQLTLTCHWDNPTEADADWGEGTTDEMCLGITYATVGG